MIVGINFGSDGKRYIARIDYYSNRERCVMRKIAGTMKYEYDEVYIVEVNNSDPTFLNEIVTNGCRM